MSSVVRPFAAVSAHERRVAQRENWMLAAWAWLGRAWRAHTTRLTLAELDDRELKDLGISRGQARFEANRPFWETDNRQ